jgi:hypothetical protein
MGGRSRTAIVSGGLDGVAKLTPLHKKGVELLPGRVRFGRDPACVSAVAAAGKFAAVCYADGCVCVWALPGMEVVSNCFLLSGQQYVRTPPLHCIFPIFLYSGTVKGGEVTLLGRLMYGDGDAHSDKVTAAALSDDGILVTAGADRSECVYAIHSHRATQHALEQRQRQKGGIPTFVIGWIGRF